MRIATASNLVTLVKAVDRLPMADPVPRGRGHPKVYSDRLILKAVVVMIVKRLPTPHLLVAVLHEPTAEMAELRMLLSEHGRFPCRRTWERRLAQLPDTLPAQIAWFGKHLAALIEPWQDGSPIAAIDSTVIRANGGVWHKQDREANIVPHTSIDTEAHWTKSGWHGWVYGWKLHLIVSVGPVWLPLAAEVTPANAADNEVAFGVLEDLTTTLRYLLGDRSYNDPDLREVCDAVAISLITSRRGPHPHRDGGVDVRRVFHALRSKSIENWNGQFKAIFDVNQPVPTRGRLATRRWVLGAVFVYQLTVLCRFEAGADLRIGLKPFIKAA
jgi:hypothetical protein